MLDSANRGAAEAIRDIMRSRPEYASTLADDWEGRVMLPALSHDKALVICDGSAFLIWCRPDTAPQGSIEGAAFGENGPIVWIVDIVARPGVRAAQVGRDVTTALHVHAGVRIGERVLFLRTKSRRVGYCALLKPGR